MNTANQHITLIGDASERTIQYNGTTGSRMFMLSNATTSLTIGNNITIQGINNSTVNLLRVEAGTLTMENGSKVTGHTTTFNSGAIVVTGANSRFVMNGGSITGNTSTSATTASFIVGGIFSSTSTVTLNGGSISGNSPLDITIDLSQTFNLSGNTQIGVLVFNAFTANNSTLNLGTFNGTVGTLHLMGSGAAMNTAISYWEGKQVIQAAGGYTLTAEDIAKFPLGNFYSTTVGASQPINPPYFLETSGANIGRLVRAVPAANISVTAPATAAAPNTSASGGSNLTRSAVSWSPVRATFQGETQYTAQITLTANTGYSFTGIAAETVTINGEAATVVSNTGNTLTISREFPATAPAQVTGIASVVTQPSKLTYTHGETLDLTGIAVKLNYNDGTTADVAFENFATYGITASLAHGAQLSHSAHNNTSITVTRTNSVTTSALTVNKKPVTITGVTANYKVYDGNTAAVIDIANANIIGSIDSDNLIIVLGAANFADKNAGDGKTVTFTDFTLGGPAAGNYTLSAQPAAVTANITPKPLSDAMIATIASQTYTGAPFTPVPNVSDVAGIVASDYTVSYANNINAGTATVTITATAGGNYSGLASATFTIDPYNVANAEIEAIPSKTYTGSELCHDPTVTDEHSNTPTFTTACTNNVNQGSATLTITGTGNYTGTKAITFTIGKKALTDAMIAAIENQVYNGSPIMPTPSVNDIAGITASDYTVSYENNTNAGTATVTITATASGNYSGTASANFTIDRYNIENASIEAILDKTYTGSELCHEPTVKDEHNNTPTFTTACTNNIAQGTATLTITGTDNYTGSKSTTFTIGKKTLADAIIAAIENHTYTGTPFTPVPTVSDIIGITASDYTVSYANNTNAGTATLTITATASGNYSGTASANFAIDKATLTPSISLTDIAGKVYDGNTSITGTQPAITLNGAVNGEAPSATATFAFANANAGSSKQVTTNDIALAGTWGNNYALSTTALTAASDVEIEKATITVTADNKTISANSPEPLYTVSITGFASNETTTNLTTQPTASSPDYKNEHGTYQIVPVGGSAANYNFTYANGTLTVEAINMPIRTIEIAHPAFEKLKEHPNKVYYVASNQHCGEDRMEQIQAQIKLFNPEKELKTKGDLNISIGENLQHYVDLHLGKTGGLDTMFTHILLKGDTVHTDTIIIVTTIDFDQVIVTKWNTLMINNNPETNGGHNFTKFEWFKNGEKTYNTRPYFALPAGGTANPNDTFSATMRINDDIELKTCEGTAPAGMQQTESSYQKRVLGVYGKNSTSKIYTPKGEHTDGKAPGVYITK